MYVLSGRRVCASMDVNLCLTYTQTGRRTAYHLPPPRRRGRPYVQPGGGTRSLCPARFPRPRPRQSVIPAGPAGVRHLAHFGTSRQSLPPPPHRQALPSDSCHPCAAARPALQEQTNIPQQSRPVLRCRPISTVARSAGGASLPSLGQWPWTGAGAVRTGRGAARVWPLGPTSIGAGVGQCPWPSMAQTVQDGIQARGAPGKPVRNPPSALSRAHSWGHRAPLSRIADC